MNSTKLFGYESLQKDFQRLVDGGNIFHAYLLYGEPQVGKFLFAQEIAAKIAHPHDVLVVDFSAAEGDDAESVGIEKVRELEHFLHQTPVSYEAGSRQGRRVAIIRDAHWLTDQAQNALLKTLEEPPASGIILATIGDPGMFLPAIRSRFQQIYIPLLPEEKILDFINNYDIIDPQKHTKTERIRLAAEIAKRAYGRIGRAKLLAEGMGDAQEKARKLSKQAQAASTNAEKKKISDAVVEFFDEGKQNRDLFIEELIETLRSNGRKDIPALRAVCEYAQQAKTMTVQKRIHLKKVLWMIK